jgi:hypothetical protein
VDSENGNGPAYFYEGGSSRHNLTGCDPGFITVLSYGQGVLKPPTDDACYSPN